MTEIQDRYWLRPTDLSSDWVRLGEDVAARINGRSHCQMQLGVIVSGGAVSDLVEPTFAALENRKGGFVQGGNWWAVIRRIRSMAPESGRFFISLHVVLDALGNPVTWTTPEVRPISGRK